MIMYEALTGHLPFYNRDWNDLNFNQAVVFEDLRPEITVKMIPQYEEIVKRCWQVNPNNRPSVGKLRERFSELRKDKGFTKHLFYSPEYNYPYQSYLQEHPSTCWTSKLWKIIAEVQDISISNESTNKNRDEINLLESQLFFLKTTLTKKQQVFFDQFVTLRKNYIRNIDNETLEEEIVVLEELMEKTEFLEETINEIKRLCDQIVKLENEIDNSNYQAIIEQTTQY
jgi:hypothetical protein